MISYYPKNKKDSLTTEITEFIDLIRVHRSFPSQVFILLCELCAFVPKAPTVGVLNCRFIGFFLCALA